MATTTTFSAAMKTKFIGPIRDQLNSNKILLEGLKTRDETDDLGMPHGSRDFKGVQADATGIDFVGNDFRMPLRSSRNQGTGPRGESATLPAPGNQGYNYITDTLKYYYGLFSITGPLLKASEKQEGAFRKALEAETKGVTDDLKRHVSIHLYGNGDAVLATITSGATSTSQVVDSTIYFQGGEYIDIYDSTLTTYRGTASVTVDSIARSTKTLTLSASKTTTTGDVIIRASSDSTSSTPNNDKSQAANGLNKIVDSTGALHGLNPATAGQGFWSSYELALSGATIGEDQIRDMLDDIGFNAGSDDDTILITTRGIRKRYAATLQNMKTFQNVESTTLRGGFKALLFDDMPMVVDDHCQTGFMYALELPALFFSQMSDWEWADDDGDVLKWQSRTDSWIAILYKYFNFGTYARNRHGKLTGAADATNR